MMRGAGVLLLAEFGLCCFSQSAGCVRDYYLTHLGGAILPIARAGRDAQPSPNPLLGN